MGYLRPCGPVTISSGWQDHRNRRPPSAEPGVDYAVGVGTTVAAIGAGRVADVKGSTSGPTGKYLTIDLDDGRRVRFLHLSVIYVGVGQRVDRGQIVAKSGASANGSDWGVGAHVHATLFPRHAYDFGSTLDLEAHIDAGTPAGSEDDMDAEDRRILQYIYDTMTPGETGRKPAGRGWLTIEAGARAAQSAEAEARAARIELMHPITDAEEGLPEGPVGTLRKRIAWIDSRVRESEVREIALQAAVGALAQVQGLDPATVQATIDTAVKDALKGLSITLRADG